MPPKKSAPATVAGAVSSEAYLAFIRQIELTNVWLSASRIENVFGPGQPNRVLVAIATEATWEPAADGFRAFHTYRVVFTADAATLAEVEVTFGVHFSSPVELTDQLFEVFADLNLPLNTWPYLREFLATTTGRMTWVPFTLPALKRGTGPGLPRGERRSAPPVRRSAKSPSGAAPGD